MCKTDRRRRTAGAYRIKQSGGQTTNTITVQSGDIAMTLENVNMAEGAGKMPPIAVESGRAPNADTDGGKYIGQPPATG